MVLMLLMILLIMMIDAAHAPRKLLLSPPLLLPYSAPKNACDHNNWESFLFLLLTFSLSFRGLHLLQLIFLLFSHSSSLCVPAWQCLRALNDACGFNTSTLESSSSFYFFCCPNVRLCIPQGSTVAHF
jgi:hypothetical protein